MTNNKSVSTENGFALHEVWLNNLTLDSTQMNLLHRIVNVKFGLYEYNRVIDLVLLFAFWYLYVYVLEAIGSFSLCFVMEFLDKN